MLLSLVFLPLGDHLALHDAPGLHAGRRVILAPPRRARAAYSIYSTILAVFPNVCCLSLIAIAWSLLAVNAWLSLGLSVSPLLPLLLLALPCPAPLDESSGLRLVQGGKFVTFL